MCLSLTQQQATKPAVLANRQVQRQRILAGQQQQQAVLAAVLPPQQGVERRRQKPGGGQETERFHGGQPFERCGSREAGPRRGQGHPAGQPDCNVCGFFGGRFLGTVAACRMLLGKKFMRYSQFMKEIFFLHVSYSLWVCFLRVS